MTSGSAVTLGEEQHQLRVGVKRQSSVILALIFKDLKSRIQGSKLGFIFVILEPLVFVSVISMMLFLFGQTEIYGVHVLLFGPTGIIPYLIFKRFLLKLSGAVGKADGLYDYPQVKPIDAIIASITLQIWLLFLASCVLMFLVWCGGYSIWHCRCLGHSKPSGSSPSIWSGASVWVSSSPCIRHCTTSLIERSAS
jgi:ABC-type polysaccharide/polyol phosphate export permease